MREPEPPPPPYYINLGHILGMEVTQHKLNKLKITEFNKDEYINPLKTKRRLLYLKTQFVPRSKHYHLGCKNQ